MTSLGDPKTKILVIMQHNDGGRTNPIWDEFGDEMRSTHEYELTFLKDHIPQHILCPTYLELFSNQVKDHKTGWLAAFWTDDTRGAGVTGNLFLELSYWLGLNGDRRHLLFARPEFALPFEASTLECIRVSDGIDAAREMALRIGDSKK